MSGEVFAAVVCVAAILGCAVWVMWLMAAPIWLYPAFGLAVIFAGLWQAVD